MQPPIPAPDSIPSPPAQRSTRSRPLALRTFIEIELFLVVAGIVWCDGTMSQISVATDLVTYAVFSVIWLTILRMLWDGRNWARLLVMFGCVITLFSLPLIHEQKTVQQVVTVFNTVFSVVWFWWLRSPSAIAFFKGKPE